MATMTLNQLAQEIRRDIVLMNCYAGSGHPGGSLSLTELLTVLFHREINFHPLNKNNEERDRLILSKGHSCLALYAVLAQCGFFSREEYKKLRRVDGMLQGHPDRLTTPGVEFNSGSLGQGFSFALGCALGLKRKNRSARVYAILGDGELNEGQIWEGFMFGAHYQLDNIVAIVDNNNLQSDDFSDNVTALSPLPEKFRAFGWHCIEIDGHSFGEIELAFSDARSKKGKPTVIVAHTIKGKGVSFMENIPKWHGSMAPTGEEKKQAFRECGIVEDGL